MGYQRKKRFGPIVDEYGPTVGGYKYKKYRPEPLAVTILKLAARKTAVNSSAEFLLNAILDHIAARGGQRKHLEYVNKRRVQRSLEYLKRKHFIAFPGKGLFTVATQGQARLAKVDLDRIKIAKAEKWDGKWRLLTFDIPEEKTNLRDYFRKRLKEIGFFHFQRSVFILPYQCKNEIDTMCKELAIESNVHLITAERFEGDDSLVKSFGL